MKLTLRLPILCTFLVLAGGLLSGCGQSVQGIPPVTLEHARQFEVREPDKAVAEYTAVRNEFKSKAPEIAAEALKESAEYTQDPNRYGTPLQINPSDPDHLSPSAIEEMKTKHEAGVTLAREALKQLYQDYPTTRVALDPSTIHLKEIVDQKVDTNNQKLLSYKIMDNLVAATGRKPWFSYWFALVMIAVFIKLITFPLMLQTYKSQREMQKMQPIIKEIQAKYKDDPMEAYKHQQAAYKEHGVKPLASCLPALVQMPIFFWMINLIRAYEIHFAKGYFLWVGSPLAARFPGIVAGNLAQLDIPILLMYAGSMYLTMKLTPQTDPAMAQQQKSMSVMMTFMMVYWFIVSKWASAFLLYYLVQNLLSMLQQYHYIYKPNQLRLAAEGGAGVVIDIPQEQPASASDRSGNSARPAATRQPVQQTVTPIPGGGAMRPRPKGKRKK